MAQRLGNVAVGTTLKLQENSGAVEYLVVNQGLPSSLYDASCNGTWLLRKEIYTTGPWGSSQDTTWEGSRIIPNFNNTETGGLSTFPLSVQNVILTVKIPYMETRSGPVMSGANGYPLKLFPLSAMEVGETSQTYKDGALLSYFLSGESSAAKELRIAQYKQSTGVYRNWSWWTRTTTSNRAGNAQEVTSEGGIDYGGAGNSLGYRWALILSPDQLVDDNNNILMDTYPYPPTTITVPTSSIPSGSTIAISWSAVEGATYSLQRSVNGGSWQTIYTGGNTSYNDTAGSWTQVRYQVASVKSGITSTYLSSSIVTVLPYTITSLTVPSLVMEPQNVPISWSPVSAATTYVLERAANNGSFTQIYSGANTSFTDTFQSGWTTLQYRVKAGANGSYGAYYTSGQIPVVSASALVISGTDSDLGTLTADVPYTVSSDTGNPITLQRKVNNNLVATLTVQSGFAYTIPVFDLPTGAGTIEIIASVNTTGGQVSATRTWQYSKASFLFPDGGGTAVLSQNSQNVLPGTIAEAVRTPTVWGGSLDKALELLLPIVKAAVISVGTYVGTGTYGESNPNTLTFNNNPVVVTIYGGGNTLAISSTDTSSSAYISGNTATWYANSAAAQMNSNGVTYSYVAVGKVV